jgi:hypothetical protein
MEVIKFISSSWLRFWDWGSTISVILPFSSQYNKPHFLGKSDSFIIPVGHK